jgi:hypothetical protein
VTVMVEIDTLGLPPGIIGGQRWRTRIVRRRKVPLIDEKRTATCEEKNEGHATGDDLERVHFAAILSPPREIAGRSWPEASTHREWSRPPLPTHEGSCRGRPLVHRVRQMGAKTSFLAICDGNLSEGTGE